MTILELAKDLSIHALLQKLAMAKREQQLAGHNLFTISNHFHARENFHSDIICSLLDPEGFHNEGYSQLELFLLFLHNRHQARVEVGNYLNTSVLREKGRIDILIRDESSRHAIIIENKINDAIDQENQLSNYYQYLTDNLYKVDAIIYLSKDGQKTAPGNCPHLTPIIRNIAAFNKTPADLLAGWLQPCLQRANNADNIAFLRQYAKLIQHLSSAHMENEVKEEFYQYVSQQKNIKAINDLKHLITTLPDYRADRFGRRTTSHAPFANRFRYQNNYWVFEKYKVGTDSYKLDVFFESTGNAKVVMWNTVKAENGGYETVQAQLERINLLDRFNGQSLYHGCTAEFNLPDYQNSIGEIDEAVFALVKDIFTKLLL